MTENPAPTAHRPVRSVIRFLGSLTFLIILLSAMLIALVLPTIVNQFNPNYGYDSTVGALRRDWYGAWWFNILMGLLMVNLAVCTVIRTPWRFFWMWGFLITHSGILTLMIGAAITFNTKIYGDLQAVEGGSYDYFTIENENEISVRTSDGDRATFQIRANPYRPSQERKSFRMPESPVHIQVEEFLPNVDVKPAYREASQGGETIVEVAAHEVDGEPSRTFIRSGDSGVRYQGLIALSAFEIPLEAFENLSGSPGEKGMLVLTLGGETREIDIAAEQGKPVRVGDAEVTVKEWGTPNEKFRDSWVRFEIARAGRSPETWVALAFDVAHSPARVDGGAGPPEFTARFRIRFTPESIHGQGTRGALYFCKTPAGFKYVFISSAGDRAAGEAKPGTRIANPFMPQNVVTFELVRWLDHAEEVAQPVEIRKNLPRNPALRITASSENHRATKWVKFFGDPVMFDLGGRHVEIGYRGRQYRDLPFRLKLEDFRVTFNRGTQVPKHFESDLELQDLDTGEVVKKTIEVNTPMKYKGFVIYQASWREDDRRISIFQISKDPGKKVLYLGWIMAVSGAIFMFFLKPFLQSLIKAGSKGADAPLGSGAAMVFFGLVTLGTILGMLAPLLFPAVDALWLGLGVAGVDLILALAVVLVARAWRAVKPVRALQVGKIIAAGWCLNTAALVILLVMKVTA